MRHNIQVSTVQLRYSRHSLTIKISQSSSPLIRMISIKKLGEKQTQSPNILFIFRGGIDGIVVHYFLVPVISNQLWLSQYCSAAAVQ
jgi:hypothetical protein